MNKLVLFVISILMLSQACKEKYEANLDVPGKILVVDARLTDEPGPQTITLSYAMPFNQEQSDPLQKAEVVVQDKYNTSYKFTETTPGIYVSDKFYPDSSNSFRLRIQTKEGKSYVSSIQALQPKGRIDTIYGAIITKTLEVGAFNMTNFVNETGIVFLTRMNLSKDNSPYYRFSNTLIIQYTTAYLSGFTSFCWLTYSANDFVNLMSPEIHSAEATHVMGFIPADLAYYGVVNGEIGNNQEGTYSVERTVHSIKISFKQYHINKDVFEYYQAMNNQLEAKQTIFDPATNQLRGNLTCEEKPEEVVLGIFEVSSVQVRTLLLNPSFSNLIFYEEPYLDIDKLPVNNCAIKQPSFW